MRKIYFQFFFIILTFFFSANCLKAQVDLSGLYNANGYFFHPSVSREISLSKSIFKIGENRYQAQLGDGDLLFEFSLDSANHLVDWNCIGLDPADPSGFMTSDNPGNYNYSSPKQPGDSPWVQSIYNNTYDTITKTLYVHYGYNTISGAQVEANYTRQIYEKWVLDHPSSKVSSFSPETGTSGTWVTIKGQYLRDLRHVSFGDQFADTAWAVSDSMVIAIVGRGATGNVSVLTSSGTGSLPGFTYIPPVVTDTQWVSAGKAGFSKGPIKTINIAMDKSDHPFVVFSDSLNGYKARVMKLNDSQTWVNVGDFVSDGASSFANIVIDDTTLMYVAFIDSTHNNNITVKRFNGSVWKTVGNPGFAPCNNIYSRDRVSLAVDGNGNPAVVSAVLDLITPDYKLSVFQFDGHKWIQLGNTDIGGSSPNGYGCLAINKRTNVPYIVADDISGISYSQLIVKAYTGGAWNIVGSPHFTSGTLGAYFPDMIIDSTGAPLVCMQEDNGRERASVYRFNGLEWIPVGPRFFSEGHAYGPSLAVDKNNMPVVSFLDAYYNLQETVMRYDSLGDNWQLVGARGFTPGENLTQNALVINSSNIPYIAFVDKTKGNKATVMHYEFVLAVSLLNFTATLQKQNVLINWETSTETNTSFFNIQRSIDGIHFINISKVAASGNRNTVHNYDFTDWNVASALNVSTVYYRIQTVDKDNHIVYSRVVSVQLDEKNISFILWPNPVKDVLNIELTNYNGNASIIIYSADGKKIKEQKMTVINQSNITISTRELTTGIYNVLIHLNNQQLKDKFIKQ